VKVKAASFVEYVTVLIVHWMVSHHDSRALMSTTSSVIYKISLRVSTQCTGDLDYFIHFKQYDLMDEPDKPLYELKVSL
jgi:hypothetical protein